MDTYRRHPKAVQPGVRRRDAVVILLTRQEVTAAGATVKEPARDVGGGRLVATVTDPDGNVLGLLQDR